MPPAAPVLLLLALVPWTASGLCPLEELLPALQKSASYLQSSYWDFNVDGVIGYRFLSDWINGTLKRWAAQPKTRSQYQQLAELERNVSSLSDQAVGIMKQTDQEYSTDFDELVKKGFWTPPTSWTRTDPTLAYHQFNAAKCYDEKLSDVCMRNVLGTGKGNGVACSVPPLCRKTMTQFGCSEYSLSHQLFYFIIAGQKGCAEHLFKAETQVYKRIFCANMMKINQKIEEEDYPFGMQDLFMENIMFCAQSGFSDFLKPSWLMRILTWQDLETGCFGKTDGCLCHMTSVAVGALGSFLSSC
ncbi:UPF0764 protein C16orf89 homolog [Ambystoma mexicanum]|uniref:UPF0764 protein C16orf89 homolog n=1 Tax=Ambystoma mexicanum TaxID=8296 RepID=UPI0037E73500